MEPCVGPMRERDLDQILAIERVSFPTPWSRHAFQSELNENEFAHYLVLRQEEKVIGYAGMWIILDEAHVTNVAVHPEHRGVGNGRRLLVELMKLAVMLGADRITLEVRKSNLVAQQLYEHMGFRSTGLRKGYYSDTNEDAIIMWKILNNAQIMEN